MSKDKIFTLLGTFIFSSFFIIIILLPLYLGKEMDREISTCKDKGGIPITERGILKACIKSEHMLDIKSSL
jgi:hypothetical protein